MARPARENAGQIIRPRGGEIVAAEGEKSRGECAPSKKMLKDGDQSHYVYENKGNNDKMPDKMSDIYVEVTRILQKSADLEGQCVVNCGFWAAWDGNLPRTFGCGCAALRYELPALNAGMAGRTRRYDAAEKSGPIWGRMAHGMASTLVNWGEL
jgi:hypothetical protein